VQATADGDGRASAAPTLRKPGEVLDTTQVGPGMGKVKMPTDQQPTVQQPAGQPQQQQPTATSPQPQPGSTPDSSSAPKLVTDSSQR
jgi:hypothetical protein